MMSAPTKWTDEEVALLRQMIDDRVPPRDMVARLGGRFTKSLIIGKYNRMGLKNLSAEKPHPSKVLVAPKHRPRHNWRPKECQFIVSDDLSTFCGKEIAKGAYCKEHYDMCYRVPLYEEIEDGQ